MGLIMYKKIEMAFDKTINNYCRILNAYYPAHNNAGFTERNLTHNFVKSLESTLGDNSIYWLEAPLSLERNSHLDAVVFCQDSKTSFLIEAKRLSNLPKKIEEIKSDIERMRLSYHHQVLEDGLKFKIENRYAIVISDVWLETEAKKSAYHSWPNCVHDSDTIWSKKGGFSSLETDEIWKNNYHILIAALQI